MIMVQCIEAPIPVRALSKPSSASAHTINPFIAQLDLAALNQQFDQATPQEILTWCIRHIPQGLAQTTSFSMLTLTHMLYRELNHPIPVIFLDTFHLFPETLETASKAQALYSLDLHTYHAIGASNRESFATRYGDRLWEKDVERFYEITKVEPLQRSLDELNIQAWITGRRRDQSDNRQDLPIFERDQQGRLKINPLANWTRREIWAYTFEHGLLYNPLHDQGYTSIGDQPLTTPTTADEDERAGRWRGTEKTECGIHW
jgi:phosphoadenosine phosphosulfate reductase